MFLLHLSNHHEDLFHRFDKTISLHLLHIVIAEFAEFSNECEINSRIFCNGKCGTDWNKVVSVGNAQTA